MRLGLLDEHHGCGGQAARRQPDSRYRHLGDERHVRLAKETCERNGLSSAEYTIHRGIAAAVAGVALFPKTEVGAWGHEPIIRPSWRERRRYLATGHYDELPLVPLSRAAADHARIDLLHVDIQGGEADLVDGALNFLGERVAYLVIGSHSREIEGRLFATLLRAGWKLEVERPAILSRESERPIVLVDGVQGWRNPKLSPG